MRGDEEGRGRKRGQGSTKRMREVLQMKGEIEPILGQLEAILPARSMDQDLVLGA